MSRAGAARSIRVSVAALSAVALFGGCVNLGERKDQANRIIESVDQVEAKGSALGTFTQSVSVVAGDRDGDTPAPRFTAPSVEIPAVLDFESGTTAYLGQPTAKEASQPFAVFRGSSIYFRRVSAERITRPWLRLDVSDIDPDDVSTSCRRDTALEKVDEVQSFANPLFVLGLLEGALAGSIRVDGTETLRGIRVTHFKLNIDREKATTDDTDRVRDSYEVAFKSALVSSVVQPAEVWLDDDGLPRKFSVTLQAKCRRKRLADLTFTTELFDIGKPVSIGLPAKGETAKVRGVTELRQGVSGSGAPTGGGQG